jgi:GR25 family glycosyltransferase involved in LPS biosynthesis
MTIGAYRSVLYDVKRRAHADLGSINAVGCAQSHATLWKQIKPGQGMYIFESDALLTENPEPYVKEFLKTNNPHMLLFGPIGRSKITTVPKIKRVNYHFFGTHGYYITYEGAQLLLKYFYPIEQQIDSYISDLILIDTINDKDVHFGINVYIINPGISYQYNVDGSSIQTKQVSILSQ